MQSFQELTNFIISLQTIQKYQPPKSPCFALISPSNFLKSCFLSSLLNFSPFPIDFSHRLSCLQIHLETAPSNIDHATFIITNTKEEFTDLQVFRKRFYEYITSLPLHSRSDIITIKLIYKLLPTATILDLPELTKVRKSENLDQNQEEKEWKRVNKKNIKKIMQDPNNIILCLAEETDNLYQEKPLDYLRRYDPYGLRSLVVFIKENCFCKKASDLPMELSNGGFIPKHGLLFLNYEKHAVDLNLNGVKSPEERDFWREYRVNKEESAQIWVKIKEIVQYSIRTVFPGLLEELHAIDQDLRAQLVDLRKEADKQGYFLALEDDENVVNYENRMTTEFANEISKYKVNKGPENGENSTKASVISQQEEEKKNSVRKQSRKLSTMIGSELISDPESAGMNGDDSFEKKNERRWSDLIKEIFANLYRSENCKRNMANCSVLTDEEARSVFTTSQVLGTKGFIESPGFQTLLSKKLMWITVATHESIWELHEILMQLITILLDKHFIKFPFAKAKLADALKDYLFARRQETMQVLDMFLDSQINYAYCSDPKKVFGELYDAPKQKKKQPSYDSSVQLLKQVCRLYCEDILNHLRECIPKMVGVVYIGEILNSFSKKIREQLNLLSEKDPSTMAAIDPFKSERDVLKKKIMLGEEAVNYILKDHALRSIVWFEWYHDQMPIHLEPPQSADKNKECEKCEDQRKASKDFTPAKLKKHKSDVPHKNDTDVTEARSVSSFDEEFSIIGNDASNNSKEISSSPVQESKESSQSSQQKQINGGVKMISNQGSPVIPNILRGMAQSHGKRKNSQMNSPDDLDYLPPIINIEPIYGNIEVINDYCLRTQSLQMKVMSTYEWLKAIQDGTLSGVDPEKVLASVQYGIPSQFRANAWLMFANVRELKMSHSKTFYEELVAKPSEWECVIEKDVLRTFGDELFVQEVKVKAEEKLNRVLRAFANYDPELGYTQGMNTIAGVVFLIMSKYERRMRSGKTKKFSKSGELNTFWIMVYLMKARDFRRCFIDGYPGLMESLKVFEDELEVKLPNVVEQIRMFGVNMQSVFMHQFMTIMGQDSPLEFFIRIMDLFFIRGEIVVKEILLRVIDVAQEEIMQVREENMFRFLKHDLVYIAYQKKRDNLNSLLVS